MPAALLDPPARQVLHLVADPHRWQLLTHLGESDRRVGELTDLLGTPQSLTSYHLRELRDAGLVTARRSSADGRDTYYRLDVDALRAQMAAIATGLHPALALVPASRQHEVRLGRSRRRVLFLCTGNSARSQMAEALLQHRTGGAIAARSAGSQPKPLHPCAVRAMAERGIDISGRRSKHLDRFVEEQFDRVVTLCDKVREVCPDFPGATARSHWSMPDPSASSDDASDTYAAFVGAADEIEARIDLLIAQLMSERATERSPDG